MRAHVEKPELKKTEISGNGFVEAHKFGFLTILGEILMLYVLETTSIGFNYTVVFGVLVIVSLVFNLLYLRSLSNQS